LGHTLAERAVKNGKKDYKNRINIILYNHGFTENDENIAKIGSSGLDKDGRTVL
jgi:hypothetical protein